MLLRARYLVAGLSLAGLMFGSGAALANPEKEEAGLASSEKEMSTKAKQKELSGPEKDVKESAQVLGQLKEQDPELAARLADAKGVFIIPDYATASLLVGGSGGEGVMMDNRNGQWGNPGFYNIGNIDIGLQAGAAAGSIVMLLMTDEAVENFRTETDFAMTAEAGLTIINWSAQAPGTTEEGDVLVWSDTEGLLAEASIGVGGISWDGEEASEYYQQEVTVDQVLAGTVQNPHEDVLQSEFAEFTIEQSDTQSDVSKESELLTEESESLTEQQ